jgi:hypothetical protein
MSQYRALKQQTGTLLRQLGDSPDEVADALRRSGVRGVPRSNRSCAIALYLAALLGSDTRVRSVRVGHCSLQLALATGPEHRPAGHLTVQLPKPVRRFVAAFDAHEYPDILREPAPPERPALGTPVCATTPTCH